MLLTVTTEDDKLYTVEVEDTEIVATLSNILEFESGIPQSYQQLWHQNKHLQPSASLKDSNVTNGDLILLRRAGQMQQGQASMNEAQAQQLLQNIRGNPQIFNSLPQTLKDRVMDNDPRVLEEIINLINAQQAAERQAEIDALNENEFDPEAQARIAERIQQANIQANMEAAMEHSPETFGQVNMLYVRLEVNGVPLKAFVDSGAQVCVMSRRCAEQCNIAHLIDKRFQGLMKGVGEQQSHGRIHTVSVKVGTEHLPMAVTVIEKSDVDLLFGLDMLRRYRCNIDLENNCLRFGVLENTSLTFLPDHELPNRDVQSIEDLKNVNEPLGSAGAAAAAGAAATARAAASTSHLSPPLDPVQTPASEPTKPPVQASPSQPKSTTGRLSGVSQQKGQDSELEAKVAQLTNLGFPRQQCLDALKACSGNVDYAAALLFGS